MSRLDRWRWVDSRLGFGIAVVVLGVALTLDNLHLVAAGRILRFWPGALGVWALAKAVRHRKDPGVLFWGATAIFALLLVGSRLRYITWDVFILWPVVLVLWGAAVIWRVFSPRTYSGPGIPESSGDILSFRPATAPGRDPDSVIDLFTLFRATERAIVTANFRGGRITTIMGGTEVDLRSAIIASSDGDTGGEATLDLFGLWGGIELRVPEEWQVVLEVNPVLSGVLASSRPGESRRQTLFVRGNVILGAVEIRN